MGLFARASDILSSNLNALLDKAEDPEKLIRMMVREMEDVLIEVKASCAGAMATKRRIQRELEDTRARASAWQSKAKLAVEKGRDNLAREALLERRRYVERAEALEEELDQVENLVNQYHVDITQLEEKLDAVRERERVMVQRHIHAQRKLRAQHEVRRLDTSNAMARFEAFEQHLDRMEAEADLVNYGRKRTLDEEFALLENDEIEKELEALRTAVKTPTQV